MTRQRHARGFTTLALACVAAVVGGCGQSQIDVSAESMSPTYTPGDSFAFDESNQSPEVGQVVLYNPPVDAFDCGGEKQGRVCIAEPTERDTSSKLLHRVVGTEGDRVAMVDGVITTDGIPESGFDTEPCSDSAICNFEAVAVPAGHVFVVGDNRGASDDSRTFGFVPAEWILGVGTDDTLNYAADTDLSAAAERDQAITDAATQRLDQIASDLGFLGRGAIASLAKDCAALSPQGRDAATAAVISHAAALEKDGYFQTGATEQLGAALTAG